MRKRKVFEDILNIECPTDDPYSYEEIEEDPTETKDLWDDYQLVKKTIKKSLQTNQDVIDILMEELRSDPSARMAEVVARLLESLSSSSGKLLEASKMIAEIFKLGKEEKDNIPNHPLFQNAIIVGNLNDILKLRGEKVDDTGKQLPNTD